ncbi:hypothetical protein [Tenacibaculum retecalamus]|uniref:hypothetical protein n=1 Tax=Tenacibaculum retecalamus TaxID=3018315 RepID=UPI0023D90543|nr:hypothetical protein [Tenacibaculum retecalamus]WBX72157.1 hypothetical protein PG912_05155 [Tenacibaculum retecalamus]
MKIAEKTIYTLFSSVAETFAEFMLTFEKEHINYKEKHLIVEISENFNATKENILLFLVYAHEHLKNGTSFVIVVKDVNIDDFPENFNIVPTLTEAEDVIEMENIQRDLGF